MNKLGTYLSWDIKRKIKRHRSFLRFMVFFGWSNVHGSDTGDKVYLRDILRNTLMRDIRRRLCRFWIILLYIKDLIGSCDKNRQFEEIGEE